jgi:hypothetical protein
MKFLTTAVAVAFALSLAATALALPPAPQDRRSPDQVALSTGRQDLRSPDQVAIVLLSPARQDLRSPDKVALATGRQDLRSPDQVAPTSAPRGGRLVAARVASAASTPVASGGDGLGTLAIVLICAGGVLTVMLAGYAGTRVERYRAHAG